MFGGTTTQKVSRTAVRGEVLAQFQPRGLTDARSGSCEKRKEHFVTALSSSEDLFDFRSSQRRFTLFFLVYDRKADEMEVPVAWIELPSLDMADATTALTTWK